MEKRGALDTQTLIFTYTRSQQSANRRAACGGVKCDAGQSCDEVIMVLVLVYLFLIPHAMIVSICEYF